MGETPHVIACYRHMTTTKTRLQRGEVCVVQHRPERWGCDRSLRRRADRLQTLIGWVVVVAALLTVVWAVVAATSSYRAGLDRIARDAASRTTVVAVLLDSATAVDSGPPRPVRVSYVDALGRTHRGQVSVSGQLPAGTLVRVEVDGNGNVGVDPPTRGDAVFSAVAAAIGVALAGAVLLGGVWAGTRSLLTARNHTAWEREWRLIEPQWSGRGRTAS